MKMRQITTGHEKSLLRRLENNGERKQKDNINQNKKKNKQQEQISAGKTWLDTVVLEKLWN